MSFPPSSRGRRLVAWLMLHRTTFGRYMYAAGGNAEAARLSGVRVNLVRATTYAISGLTAGIGGMIKVEQGEYTHQAMRAIGSGFQSVLFADVRTLDEQGLRGVDSNNWYALVAPSTVLPSTPTAKAHS